MQKKEQPKANIYISTTIFAIIGTILYSLIVKFLYGSYLNWINVIVFFVVIWIVYLWVIRRAYRRFAKQGY